MPDGILAAGADRLAPCLLDAAVKGALVLILATAVSVLLRRRSAALRHLVLVAAFAGVVLMPILSFVAPPWRIPVLDSLLPQGAAGLEVVSPPVRQEMAGPLRTGSAAEIPLTETGSRAAAPRAVDWASVLGILWIAGAAAMLFRLVAGLAWASMIVRRAGPVRDGRLERMLRDCRGRIGLRGPVRLLASGRTALPFAWGVLSPAVVLPGSTPEWPDERLMIVLLHELTHVKRHDVVLTLLCETAAVVHWYNPLVWFLLRRLFRERELACDDCVLSTGIEAVDYAQHLVDTVKALRARRRSLVMVIAFAREVDMRSRITAILDRGRSCSPLRVSTTVITTLLALAFVVPIAGVHVAALPGTPAAITQESVKSGEAREIEEWLSNFYDALGSKEIDEVKDHYLAKRLRIELDRPENGFTVRGDFDRLLEREGIEGSGVRALEGATWAFSSRVIDVEADGADRIVTEKVSFVVTTSGGAEIRVVDDQENRIVLTEAIDGHYVLKDTGDEMPGRILGGLLEHQKIFFLARSIIDPQTDKPLLRLDFPDDLETIEYEIIQSDDGTVTYRPMLKIRKTNTDESSLKVLRAVAVGDSLKVRRAVAVGDSLKIRKKD